MAYIPPNCKTEGGQARYSKPLGVMRSWHGPRIVCLSRAPVPPILGGGKPEPPETEIPDPIGVESGTNKGNPNKSELVGFSRRSSLALSKLLSSIDWERNGRCVHVTLTYHRVFPSSKDDLASEKSGITRDVVRLGFTGVWRLEYQSRDNGQKVPHWHCLLWHPDPEPLLGRLERWWWRFSGNKSRFAVKITSGDQARGTWYLAMHAAKRDQSPPFAVGRWWGYFDRERFLTARDVHCHGEISERELVWWLRLYRRSTGCRTRNSKGCSWFLSRVGQTQVGAWVLEQVGHEKLSRACRSKERESLNPSKNKGKTT